MKVLNRKECRLVAAALDYINRELCRCYWNKNQKETSSPFENTGNMYECDTFKVRAYNWKEDNNENFVYYKDNVKVSWYKYCGRGMHVEVPDDWTIERLVDMLADCAIAIEEDFKN